MKPTTLAEKLLAAHAGLDVVVDAVSSVEPAREAAFPIDFHIPGWCASPAMAVNGAASTTIDGGGSFRCVYLASNAILSGFTLTHGGGAGAGVVGAAGYRDVPVQRALTVGCFELPR